MLIEQNFFQKKYMLESKYIETRVKYNIFLFLVPQNVQNRIQKSSILVYKSSPSNYAYPDPTKVFNNNDFDLWV